MLHLAGILDFRIPEFLQAYAKVYKNEVHNNNMPS